VQLLRYVSLKRREMAMKRVMDEIHGENLAKEKQTT
jgi:hypothetical protein